jgi:hypothetical protein
MEISLITAVQGSASARNTLARIETANGDWTAYGNDGRLTIDKVDYARQQSVGHGFRARFVDSPHGGDCGWGPLAQTEIEAIALFLAEYVACLAGDSGLPKD